MTKEWKVYAPLNDPVREAEPVEWWHGAPRCSDRCPLWRGTCNECAITEDFCTPGNDVESTTGLAGSGANIIVFTTGLGTPTGNPVCPVIKMSSNTELYEQMKDIIDFDAGSIVRGGDSIQSLGEKLLDYIIEAASGRIVPAAVRLGQDDFLVWKRGISL